MSINWQLLIDIWSSKQRSDQEQKENNQFNRFNLIEDTVETEDNNLDSCGHDLCYMHGQNICLWK